MSRRAHPQFRANDAALTLRRVLALANTFALLLAGATPALADTAPAGQTQTTSDYKQLSLSQLGNIAVTSVSKEPQPALRVSAAIYVLTQDDIRRSGATSVPEVLRLVPGVEVARIDSDNWSVGIRGFGSQFSKSVLVLIDGRSVYSPLFSGVYWDVQNVMLEDVDRIEVIRGPGGTIWGANAVNGVINIITKSAKQTHGTLVSTAGGGLDQGSAAIRFGGGNGSTADYRVYGLGFGRATEFHPDGSSFDAWQTGQGGFRTDLQRGDRDSLIFQGDIYKGYDGSRVSVSTYNPPAAQIIDAPNNVSGGNLVASWRRRLNEGSDFQVKSYYDRTSRLSPQLDEIRNTLDLDFIYRLNGQGRNALLMGAGARWSADNITQRVATINFLPNQETDSIYSGFLQDVITVVPDRLSLTIGSKFEHNNYSGFDIQPSARMLWTPSDRNYFWAAFTRAERTPSRLDQDLQLTDFLASPPPLYLRVVGSKSFQAEELLGTAAGYRTLVIPNLYVDTDFFHNDYDHLYGYGPQATIIETAPAPTHIVLQIPLANATAGDTIGFEVAPDWQPRSWFELKGSYSYLHLYVHNIAGAAGIYNVLITDSDNGSSPHHETEAQSFFHLPHSFEADLTYRFVSALPGETSSPAGPTVNAYSTGDVRVAWSPRERFQISFVGQNLFQPEHPEFGGDDGPLVGIRRSYYGKLTLTR
jgi:iron complex outermembrane receptor protein